MINMSIREAAHRLGGSVAGGRTVTCPGPGHSARDRSLSVTFDTHGEFIVFSHAGDDWQVCRDHVRDLLGLGAWSPGRADPPPRRAAQVLDEDDNKRLALRIWSETSPIAGTLAERYLRSRRLEVVDGAAEALRFHPLLRFGDKSVPGMVALYRRLRSDEPVAIQRMFIDPEGRKLDRRMLGSVREAAVKISPDDGVTLGLVVGEGVESCLAAAMLGYRPVWALGSAGAIAKLPVIPRHRRPHDPRGNR